MGEQSQDTAFCQRCMSEVVPGALRCKTCDAPFQGPEQVETTHVPPVRTGRLRPSIDPTTGGLQLPGIGIEFGWPAEQDD